MKAEWRLTKAPWGEIYAECHYIGDDGWSGWFFPISKQPKAHYKWNEQIGVYVRNTSID